MDRAQRRDESTSTRPLPQTLPQTLPNLHQNVFPGTLSRESECRTAPSEAACRDTKNPTWHTKERNFGDLHTTTILAHSPPDAGCFGKPQFANKPLIRDTFYRKTNVQFPDDCAAINVSDA